MKVKKKIRCLVTRELFQPGSDYDPPTPKEAQKLIDGGYLESPAEVRPPTLAVEVPPAPAVEEKPSTAAEDEKPPARATRKAATRKKTAKKAAKKTAKKKTSRRK